VAISWSVLEILGITNRDLEGDNCRPGQFRKRLINMKKQKKIKKISYMEACRYTEVQSGTF
jgi:hypothetical protein